jgi:hypothetical protein
MHGQMDNPTPWVISSIWVLTLDLVLFVAIYSALSLIHALSDCAKRRRGAYLHVMTTGLVAAGIAEVCRRIIFPTISLGRVESAAVAAIMGTAIAATWAGIALRRPARRHAGVSGIDLLLTPTCRRSAAVALLIVLPLATGALLSGMARMDWDFVMQRLCVIVEFAIAYGLVLRLAEDAPSAQRWSQRLAVVPAVFALALVFGVPRATAAVAAMAGDRTLEPAVVLDRYAAAELSAKLIASQIVAKPGFDSEYLRYLQVHADVAGKMSITVPTAEVFEALPGSRPLTPAPDIFVFVVDSLRRDYVSPYNPAVTFTPNIARFASDSFVFQNAFTRYGGTELAMPSIWAGGPVVRKVQQAFHRINAVEKTLNRHGYRVAISDYTVARHLRPPTPITTLESGVSSAESDVCRFVEELEDHLDSSAADRRPVFGFSSPMNVHILNTRRGGQSSLDRDYPGFYSPYASRMKRVDACFGEFTAYLKRHNRYDNSIIVLTSDHGDSLGEDGNWGHAFWLFPEDVRIPLVVHIPEALKSQVTTDLARVAFSTDIAPTLSALLGDRVRRVNPLFGEPLFVPSQQTLSDRRRQSFLLVSSYGPTYGILRRNGRLLYISDLVDWHESAFDLTQQPIGSRVVVEDELRRVNQRLIRDGVAAVASFYSVRP